MAVAVGEIASVKRRKLWKTGEDGLCCSSSAIQTRLGPSSLLEERSGVPIVFVVLLCCRLPPKLGEMAKVYRIDRCLSSGLSLEQIVGLSLVHSSLCFLGCESWVRLN